MNGLKIFMIGVAFGFLIGWQRKVIVSFTKPYVIKAWIWAKSKVGIKSKSE